MRHLRNWIVHWPMNGIAFLPTRRYIVDMKKINAYEQILDIAEELVQKRGFNAFSYADIAEKIGLKKASIHYHFPAKSDLGKALMERHRINIENFLLSLSSSHVDCKGKLLAYLNAIFESTFKANRKMCLGGMLAADILTLDKDIQTEVKTFFDINETWLKKLLTEGKRKGEFHFSLEASEIAKQILTTIEGSILLARLYEDEMWLNTATKQVIKFVS